MSINTFWKRRAKYKFVPPHIAAIVAPSVVHWRVTEYEDINGMRIKPSPPNVAWKACELAEHGVASVITFAVPTKNFFIDEDKPKPHFKSLLTCEACIIMWEGLNEP